MKLLLSFALISWLATLVYGDYFQECEGVPKHKFLSSNKSCAHFIFCDDDESYEGECATGDYFSYDRQMCDPMKDVDCRLGMEVTQQPATDSSSGADTGLTTVTSIVSTTTTIKIPTATSQTQPTFGTTTVNPVVSTTDIVGTSSVSANTSSAVNTIVLTACPSTDNPQQFVFMANPKSCSEYFVCYHGESLPMHCAPMLHFNAKTGKCDHAENVKCLADATNVREQCKSNTVDLYPHSTNCNYFYFCRNGYLLLQQCPFYYGWDYEKRSCVALSQAKCYAHKKLRFSY